MLKEGNAFEIPSGDDLGLRHNFYIIVDVIPSHAKMRGDALGRAVRQAS